MKIIPLLVTLCTMPVIHPNEARGAEADLLKWSRQAFPLPESIWSVEAVDINADAKLDLVAMGQTKVFALVAPDWKERMLFDTEEPKLLYCVALDADGDGDQDIALGRYRAPWIEYRQAREAGKEVSKPRGSDFSVAWLENNQNADGGWPLHVIDRELNGIHGLWTGDIDGDGKRDVIADSILGPSFPRSMAWFQTPANKGGTFQRHIITKGGADGRPHYLDFKDMNGDGKGDVLLGDSGGGTFTWWENPGKTGEWTKHLVAKQTGATNMKGVDVNRDGVVDVIGSCGHGKGVFWFEGPSWKQHAIDQELSSPHALASGDFDKDGDEDVAVASFTAFIVRWYRNDGKGAFTPHDIDTEHKQQAYDLKSVDLDGDGRLELILAGRETRNAVIYWNRK